MLQRQSLISPFLLTCHTRNALSAEAKSFPTKIFFQSDVIWKVRCAKHLDLFYRCPLLLDRSRSKHFIRHSLLLDRFALSLYVDQGLQRQHRSFLFVRRWGQQKLMTFLLKRVLSLSEHCLPLFVRDSFSKLDPFLTLAGISKRARAILMQVLVKERTKFAFCDYFQTSKCLESLYDALMNVK